MKGHFGKLFIVFRRRFHSRSQKAQGISKKDLKASRGKAFTDISEKSAWVFQKILPRILGFPKLVREGS